MPPPKAIFVMCGLQICDSYVIYPESISIRYTCTPACSYIYPIDQSRVSSTADTGESEKKSDLSDFN